MQSRNIYIRLFAGLNFFVPEKLRQRNIQLPLFGKPSVKDVIESVGVPHTEFEMVTLNGQPIETDQNVKENDQLVVYPHFYQLPIDESNLASSGMSGFKFVLDVHLGKLAALLRLFGFDSVYNNMLNDNEIIDIANAENRIILSRDLGIFKNSKVRRGYFPRSQDPKIQLKEIFDRFELNSHIKPFSRCIKCNGALISIDKRSINDEIEERTKLFYHEFYRCNVCKRIYWKGSHYYKMMEMVENYSQN